MNCHIWLSLCQGKSLLGYGEASGVICMVVEQSGASEPAVE